jgi:RHS repeat-associated protein
LARSIGVYTYDAAGRMATVSLNGVLQAEYQYSATGQQVVRRLVPSNVTIHNVFDSAGNRIAEYQFDPATGVSTLIREYIWANGQAVGVFEGGQLYFIRSDHIGRPVFATNDTGTVVWTASYLPFCGVRTTTGTPIALRFPGQWFQMETGLHQNRMRDYDPTTGRYLQADPLGMVDGASVYGYALQSPLRWMDPRREDAVSGVGGPIAFAAYCARLDGPLPFGDAFGAGFLAGVGIGINWMMGGGEDETGPISAPTAGTQSCGDCDDCRTQWIEDSA